MSEELEDRLRRALADRAERVEPAPDGLSRIRERTRPARGGARDGVRGGVRDGARWRVPALALAGTAALIAAVFVAPAVLPPLGGPDGPPAASGSSAPTGTDAPTPTPTPTPTDGPIPGAGVNDMVTVWPYASRGKAYAAERAGAPGPDIDLTQPDVVAVTFVQTYVGASQALTAESTGKWQAGLRMRVSRGDTPVSLVYLVRVRMGNDAPYVVVGATSAELTIVAAPGDEGVVASGTRSGASAASTPQVDFRAPGATQSLLTGAAVPRPGGWSAEMLLPAGSTPRTRTDAVAVWTLNTDGQVTAFAADSAAP